jgi:preprotein translocase subunit SecG
VWGQLDSVGSLFALAALLLLYEDRSEWAAVMATLAILTKPQFGVVALIVAVVLVQRHLGPALSTRLGGRSALRLAEEDHSELAGARPYAGPVRLVTAAMAALGAGLLLIMLVDLDARATGWPVDVPIIGNVAGLIAVVGRMFTYFTPLTANAYNPWVFIGSHPYFLEFGAWTFDRVRLIGPIHAWMVGTGLLLTALAATVVHLLARGRRAGLLVTAAILTAAFFLLPTRAHERYIFPLFVYAAPLAAIARPWMVWYLLLGIANGANLYAVLTTSSASLPPWMPDGALLRSPEWIALIAIAQTALIAWAAWRVVRGTAPDLPPPPDP